MRTNLARRLPATTPVKAWAKPPTEDAPSVRARLDEPAARRRDARQANQQERFDGWLGQRPELAAALRRADVDLRAWQAWDGHQDPASKPDTPLAWDPFLAELTRQLCRREPLSDRQAEFYVRRVTEVTSHHEQQRQRQARQVAAPEGTVTFGLRAADTSPQVARGCRLCTYQGVPQALSWDWRRGVCCSPT